MHWLMPMFPSAIIRLIIMCTGQPRSFKTIWLILLLLLSIFSPQAGSAEETDWIAVGFRAGLSATHRNEDFKQYEVFATYGLPWSWGLAPGWFLSTRINLSAGALRGGGETGFIGSVGPSIALSMARGLILLDGGISAALLSEHQFGREDFGGPIQFVSHVGISFKPGDNLGVGYRFQHMSNASIYNQNPGLELHLLELSYFF
jgi:hypothetical protein